MCWERVFDEIEKEARSVRTVVLPCSISRLPAILRNVYLARISDISSSYSIQRYLLPGARPVTASQTSISHRLPRSTECQSRGSVSFCLGGGGSNSDKNGFSNSGGNDSKTVLDAFFLGKAFAETLNERVESTVGEILSVVGQWQSEQQKQIADFQEEVVERARRDKENAAIEAMDESKSSASSDSTFSSGITPSPIINNSFDDPLMKMFDD